MAASDHLQSQQMWHGSPSGDLRGAPNGLHIGSREAARQALNARIGTPIEGDWDGSREYGKTMVRGYGDFTVATGYSHRAVHEPHFPSGAAAYADRTPVALDARPNIFPVDIVGKMTNTRSTPHEDFKANGYMSAAKKRGTARSGYYYENVGEDAGNISAVVPDGSHIRRPRAVAQAAATMLGGKF